MTTAPMDTVKITDLTKRDKRYTSDVSFKDIDLDRFYILSTKVVGPLRYTLFALKDNTRAYLLMEGKAGATTIDEVLAFAKSQKIAIRDEFKPSIKGYIEAEFTMEGEQAALIVAEGRDPVPGVDSRVEWHVEEPFDNRGAATSDEQVDYRQRRNFVHVNKGQHILTVHPPTRGQPGMDFRGNEVPTSDGAWNRPLAGLGITCEANQQNMYSECEGILQLTPDNKLHVRSMLEVHDVDFKTGNIHFEGDVDVGGFIREGFEVHSKGVVRVVNDIERAHCEGSEVAVSGAILNSTVIARGGPIMLGRCERSTLRADGDIVATSDMVGSTVHCGGTFIMEGKSFVGGEIHALGGAKIGWLGGKENASTLLVIDPKTCQVPASDEARAKVEEIATQMRKLEAALGPLIKNRGAIKSLPPAKHEPIKQLLAKYDALEFEADVAAGSQRRAAAELRAEAEGPVEVVISRGISAGVTIKMGEATWASEQEQAGSFVMRLSKDGNEIEVQSA